MSDSEKYIAKDSNYISVKREKSWERLPRSSESQSIVINFYSNSYSQKKDQLIQTEHVLSQDLAEKKAEEDTIEEKADEKTGEKTEEKAEERVEEKEEIVTKREVSTAVSEHSLGKRNSKYGQILIRKLSRTMSDEKKDEKPMDIRKPNFDSKPAKAIPPAKQASDLERKRMQAELKAAEEIARIKQTLIEKRLAFELATIDDCADLRPKSSVPRTAHQAELRALEEMALRKQSLIETNLAQELESLDYQTRVVQAPRPPPPPSPPPRPSPSPQPKLNPFKTESTSSVMNSLRGLGMQKMNLDKKFSGDSGQRTPNPVGYIVINDRRYQEPRRDERYSHYPPRPDVEYNYGHHQEYSKARSTWKSAVAKIKKKMKSKPTHNWDDD